MKLRVRDDAFRWADAHSAGRGVICGKMRGEIQIAPLVLWLGCLIIDPKLNLGLVQDAPSELGMAENLHLVDEWNFGADLLDC